MSEQVIKTKPAPYCPDCGAKMALRKPRHPNQHFDAFWGCTEYPDCFGKRDILPDGRPDMYEEEY
jgi:ssDNA-binding Zn-finger/Zn-ribbon topoisomerase 1